MKRQINAFTLAEVLITLGIIGVVAALTLPTLIKKYEAKALETQFEKAYSVLSQSNRMMLAQGTFPYEEFVLQANIEEPEVTPPDSGDSGETVKPEEPSGGGGDSGGGTGSGGSGSGSMPDMSDETTVELVDKILDNIWDYKNDDEAKKNVDDAYNALKDKYGDNNFTDFLKDYGEEKYGFLGGFVGGILGGLIDEVFGNNDNGDNKGGFFNRRGSINYKHIFAAISGDNAQGASSNFVSRKKRQLEALKKNLSGAQYCKSYNECGSSPITYYNLTGTEEASIEAADFENSALILSNGSIIWLGDETNPQRYFVDVNGVKGPNRLGVDVFTFNLSKKNTIDTERTGDCTISNSPASGESYRGLGCSGYAAVNENPDDKAKPYWSSVR